MGIVLLIVILVAIIGYQYWLRQSVKSRSISTNLSQAELDAIFEQTVAGKGWKIVDDGNPMIAQSPLLTGIRQQIQMQVSDDGNRRQVLVGPVRLVTKWTGVPTKAHTIRLRINSFVRRAQSKDSSLQVETV